MHACIHTYIHTYLIAYITYVYVYTHMYIYIYIYLYVFPMCPYTPFAAVRPCTPVPPRPTPMSMPYRYCQAVPLDCTCCLPKMAHLELSFIPEVHPSNHWILPPPRSPPCAVPPLTYNIMYIYIYIYPRRLRPSGPQQARG